MGRRYALTLSLLVLGLFAGSTARAGIPDPALCTIPNVAGVPGGGLLYKVTIVGASGPIANANVTLVWATAGDTATCWCPTQVHPNVTATTNASGIATFNLALGGCLNPATIPGGIAVQVWVDGVQIKQVGQVSPDVASVHSPPCNVALTDAVSFTFYLSSNTYSFCYDLNSDNIVGIADAVALTPYVSAGVHCP